jgi:hypothetical protein
MIKPTLGRVVLFHPDATNQEVRAAFVAQVQNDALLNLMVLSSDGTPMSRTAVTLVQPGETPPERGEYCEWPEHTAKAEKPTTAAAKPLEAPAPKKPEAEPPPAPAPRPTSGRKKTTKK